MHVKMEAVLRKHLQSTKHDGKHGGDGKSSIGVMVPNKITPIPEQKSITTENSEVCCTQSHSLGKSALVTKPLSDLQGCGIGL